MRENNYSKIETKKRLAALLVAFVFMFGTTVIPSQIYAVENDDQAATESIGSEAVTEETAGADETSVDVNNPEAGSEESAETEAAASEEEAATDISKLEDLIIATDENGNSINIDELDESEYDGFLYKLKDDTTKAEVKEMEGAIDELGGEQKVEEVVDKELYSADSIETISEVASAEQIEHIEPNYIVKAFEVPNDRYYGADGWFLKMINAPYVWSTLGDKVGEDTVVAIIDTGVRKTHEDFSSDLFTGQRNFIDGQNPDDVTDYHGHGTGVTGVIAATYNNGKGITGIAPGAKIMPIKALEKDGENATGSYKDIIEGIEYAAENGADVINMSLGDYHYVPELEDACERAADKGIILVAAVGNEAAAGNPLNYPAGFKCVVGVGGVANNGQWSYISNYNNSVAVTAPGENIRTTYRNSNSSYVLYTGTSFAAPQVSAMAAMVKSVAKKKGITVNHDVFTDIIACTSVDKGAAGYDKYYGYGLMDIGKAYRYVNGDISACRASLSGTSYTYDGSSKTPSVSVRWLGKTLSASNYSASYSSGRAAVGTYKVTVAGKGSLYGSKTLSFNVVPPLVKGIKSPSRAKKKLTVRWNAMSKKQKKKYKGVITGYQVRVSTNASFSGAKYASVKGLTKTKATVKGLKKKTYYYVQYRSYKTTGSGTYYSKWSGIKKAKTK